MIGVVLAGGNGTRLRPLTNITNKHLLPVYDKPMVEYPLSLLAELGVRDIVLVTGREFAGEFADLLGDGSSLGLDITYKIQSKAAGIAHAISITEKSVKNESIITILGDNIFSLADGEKSKLKNIISKFDSSPNGAVLFLSRVNDPERFGVANIENGKIISIEEKPTNSKSNLAVTGLYIYDNSVFDKIKKLKPSKRNELEITDVNNAYIKEGRLRHYIIKGKWTDAGTFESLFKAHIIARRKALKNNRTR